MPVSALDERPGQALEVVPVEAAGGAYSKRMREWKDMERPVSEFLWDDATRPDIAAQVARDVWNELRSGLLRMGFEVTNEQSFGLIALRVFDRWHVGTAFVELIEGSVQMRLVLLNDQEHDERESPVVPTVKAVTQVGVRKRRGSNYHESLGTT